MSKTNELKKEVRFIFNFFLFTDSFLFTHFNVKKIILKYCLEKLKRDQKFRFN